MTARLPLILRPPLLTGDVITPTPGGRAFYGLTARNSPADATLVQNNVLPLDEPIAVTDRRRRIDLPSVAVDVPRGQNLYLLSSPPTDTFVDMGGRVPGLVTTEDGVVHLPVVGR